MKKDSKIYVAGHRGLVGSALLKNLKEKGYQNLVYRTHDELDLSDAHKVATFFAEERPDYVFLAAAKVGGIMANTTYRADFLYQNLAIQNAVIHQSYVHGVKKLLFLGSTCIYPKDCNQPMKEDYLLTDVLEYTNEPYAIAKIAGIKMCESYNLQYGTNFISVMPTNLYGLNDNFDLERSHVLPALLRKIHLGNALQNRDWDLIRKDLKEIPIAGVDGTASETALLEVLERHGIALRNGVVDIEIWGSGKPMREFLWSDDMADACIFLMENRNFEDCYDPRQQSEIRNTHINIGTGKDISIKNLAEVIREIIGFTGNFHFNTDKPDGTFKKLTDVSKLRSMGWSYTTELEEGIRQMYHWYLQKQ